MIKREENPDELDAMIAAGAFDDEDQLGAAYEEWLDEQADAQYAEYQMRKIAEQYGEEF